MTAAATAVHAVRSEDPVLRAAAELFYARGIAAVSVQDIRSRAGVSLKSMYATYPSKEELVVAYLRRTHEVWMRELRAAIDAAPDFAGCGIANTRGQAIGERSREVVREHVSQLEQLCVEVAGDEDSGRTLLLLVEGAIATAAATGDARYATVAHQTAQASVLR